MNKYLVAVAAAVLMGSMSTAIAHEHHKGHHKHGMCHENMFKEMGMNKEGIITHDAYMASAEQRFKDMDAKGDGKVTREEVEKYHKARWEKCRKHHEKKSHVKEEKKNAADGLPVNTESKPDSATPVKGQ